MTSSVPNPLFGVPQPEQAGAILALWVGAAVLGNVLGIALIAKYILLQYPSICMQLRTSHTFLWHQPQTAEDAHSEKDCASQLPGDDACKFLKAVSLDLQASKFSRFHSLSYHV